MGGCCSGSRERKYGVLEELGDRWVSDLLHRRRDRRRRCEGALALRRDQYIHQQLVRVPGQPGKSGRPLLDAQGPVRPMPHSLVSRPEHRRGHCLYGTLLQPGQLVRAVVRGLGWQPLPPQEPPDRGLPGQQQGG
ncbi:hypothetical protein ADK52_35180 [Streptomyces sp. WM6372]|nr:hypothetical protein ADK52_35180 [Streptomyces sp. WM6372]